MLQLLGDFFDVVGGGGHVGSGVSRCWILCTVAVAHTWYCTAVKLLASLRFSVVKDCPPTA
jgi:hypothetical protein